MSFSRELLQNDAAWIRNPTLTWSDVEQYLVRTVALMALRFALAGAFSPVVRTCPCVFDYLFDARVKNQSVKNRRKMHENTWY